MKKLIALLLGIIMIFSLAACAGTTPNTPSGTTPSNGSQTTPNNTNDTKNPDITTSGENSTTGTTDPAGTTVTPAADGKTLVVYFSGSGNTKRVAEDIAAATGGTLFELVPVTPYTSADLSWTTSGSRVNREHDDETFRWSQQRPKTLTNTIRSLSATPSGGASRHGRSITS